MLPQQQQVVISSTCIVYIFVVYSVHLSIVYMYVIDIYACDFYLYYCSEKDVLTVVCV